MGRCSPAATWRMPPILPGSGRMDFVRLVVAGRGEDFCVPCGICRQVIREFAPQLEIICLNGMGEERSFSLEELLPHSFGPEHLGR